MAETDTVSEFIRSRIDKLDREAAAHAEMASRSTAEVDESLASAERASALAGGLRDLLYGKSKPATSWGHDFAPGDVVRLKHGGPKMTVETVDDDGTSVLWFDAADCLQSAYFSNAALELASVH